MNLYNIINKKEKYEEVFNFYDWIGMFMFLW